MKRVLMFDAIPMQGGSKIANAELLKQCDKLNVIGYLLTTNPEHWEPLLSDTPRVQIIKIKPSPLSSTHGLTYWLMNAYYFIQLIFACMKLPKIDSFLGLSCPSNDMPLYLLRLISKKPVVQMVHGPIGRSRSSGYCLVKASAIYYLANTRESMLEALQVYLKTEKPATERYWCGLNSSTFVNGLSRDRWPKQANPISNRVFWAASLLKWKNIDLFLDALTLDKTKEIKSTVCYIKPNVAGVEYSTPDFTTKGVEWHECPDNLDDLRSQCGVFVSTSVNEPFGLSILEALAAGMCIVIPHDDSYWDRVLTHGRNCIKYTPNNVASLHNAIRLLNESPWMKVTMGIEALNVSQLYTAERCYLPIAQHLAAESAPNGDCKLKTPRYIKGYDHV
ncbi:glycosyltransferase family 4 protein [Vibrio diabolicus]|uniref:glycosyltransferase family 4 protein n=1 Tax=Vibrio diabolicus TaxID=50719 RepID=UPI003D7C57B5